MTPPPVAQQSTNIEREQRAPRLSRSMLEHVPELRHPWFPFSSGPRRRVAEPRSGSRGAGSRRTPGRTSGSRIVRWTCSCPTTFVRAGRFELPPLSGPRPKPSHADRRGGILSVPCALISTFPRAASIGSERWTAVRPRFVSNPLARCARNFVLIRLMVDTAAPVRG
jgi:hypothetical protein